MIYSLFVTSSHGASSALEISIPSLLVSDTRGILLVMGQTLVSTCSIRILTSGLVTKMILMDMMFIRYGNTGREECCCTGIQTASGIID